MKCSSCQRPIKTRYMYSVAEILGDETKLANFCSLCFDAIVPRSSIRRLRHFFSENSSFVEGQTEHASVYWRG